MFSRRLFSMLGLFGLYSVFAANLLAQEPLPVPRDPASALPAEANHVTRLFFQDMKSASVKWVDVFTEPNKGLGITPSTIVQKSRKLDPQRQKLVQMRESGGLIVAGVRDDRQGAFESGHLVINTGVGKSDHGEHTHWSYLESPSMIDSRLGPDQGNPAHVYSYGGKIFVANDRNNGYTRLDPASYVTEEGKILGKGTTRFLKGGGNHITLAVVEDKVGYSAWIDGGGPNKGRVDVTPITISSNNEPSYSFHLPHGGIHGATVSCGKVFFAPVDGICWLDADLAPPQGKDSVQVRHISLGMESDKPVRTGAFATLGKFVAFTTGKGSTSRLAILDASGKNPAISATLDLKVEPGCQALTPELVKTPDERLLAFVFHDEVEKAGDNQSKAKRDKLQVVELDPNRDGSAADANVLATLEVGPSCVEGHFGHHSLAFDADCRHAFIANPGDGTVSILPLANLGSKPALTATFRVGGSPTHLIARGGKDLHD